MCYPHILGLALLLLQRKDHISTHDGEECVKVIVQYVFKSIVVTFNASYSFFPMVASFNSAANQAFLCAA
jgi:hypothetical protein